ncbi:HDIG domain-containing metalloprotein [Kribbella sp. CA-293567]|uniref:HDIG domain-containing metalloprotein n=1 Tax=Kribbella sp. CA-293567 TaxID=3002436 RepID=UPI0022DDC1F2|nr:HDIG domain-containing metalloprotein [Kribbella sp. CA-293567]WBQ06149.1 HDIG domain-containing protein [Kribbella sp. CA-293567]
MDERTAAVNIPTDREIRALHAQYASTREAFEVVHDHCRIVCDLAEQVIKANNLTVDVDLVRAGCLLHDLGVHRLDGSAYIRHGVLGHELLLDLGFPEVIARFCSHHTGVGLTREDVTRQALPIPVGDYLAETVEEELVMYADKFHSKSSPPRFVTAAAYRTAVLRFGVDKAARFDDLVTRYGEPDLPRPA